MLLSGIHFRANPKQPNHLCWLTVGDSLDSRQGQVLATREQPLMPLLLRFGWILLLLFSVTSCACARPASKWSQVVLEEGVRTPYIVSADYLDRGEWLAFGLLRKNTTEGVIAALKTHQLQLRTEPFAGGPVEVAADGETLAFRTSPQEIAIWSPPHPPKRWPLPLSAKVDALAFSPDQETLAVCQVLKTDLNQVTLMDLSSGKPRMTLSIEGGPVERIKFAPDGGLLGFRIGLHSAYDYDVTWQFFQLYNTRTGEIIRNVPTKKYPLDFEFSADSTKLYSLSWDGIEAWSITNWQLDSEQKLPHMGRSSRLTRLDDSLLRIDLEGTSWGQVFNKVILYETASKRTARTLEEAKSAEFSSDGKTLWTLDSENRLGRVDLEDGNPTLEEAPIAYRAPLSISPYWQSSTWLRVHSPESGQAVLGFVPLKISEDFKLEWLSWNARGAFAGSPEWRDYARLAPGQVATSDKRAQIIATLRSPNLTGRVNRPKSYLSQEQNIARTEKVGELLDEVVQTPGGWNQMCSLPTHKPRTQLPLKSYHRDWAPAFVSPQNFLRLREYRKEVLQEISFRLLELLPDAVDNTERYTEKVRNKVKYAWDWTLHSASLEIYLMILVDLNGTEALPTLLEFEAALAAVAPYRLPAEALEKQASDFTPTRYLEHTQVLSVLATILEAENVPVRQELGDEVTYNQKHRDRLVKMAHDFLAATPPDRYKGEAAMSPKPSYR